MVNLTSNNLLPQWILYQNVFRFTSIKRLGDEGVALVCHMGDHIAILSHIQAISRCSVTCR